MTFPHTKRVLWAFGVECLILVAILLSLDWFPAWVLKASAILAICLPIICYLSIATEPTVYRSWLQVGAELRRSLAEGIRSLRRCFSIDTVRRIVRWIGTMKVHPTTFDDWFATLVLPFKVYVIAAIPFLWACHALYSFFSSAPTPMSRSEALPLILTGYALCLLALLIGALFQSLFSERGRATRTILMFLVGIVMLWMLPWIAGR